MKLIIISDPVCFNNEAETMNTLFNEGLEILHLRKPTITSSDLEKLIHQIDSKFHPKISLHQHYHLTEKFNITKIHLPESVRKSTLPQDFLGWKTKKNSLSTSIHKTEDYNLLHSDFEYAFFGPVFNSISKKDYQPTFSILDEIKQITKTTTKLIAIGGIQLDKLNELKQTNFDGIALLGTIWQSKQPVKEFIQLKKAWQQAEIMF